MTAKKAAPKRTSGYYNTPQGKLRSVTTIVSEGVAKPALVNWAAFEVAQAAVDNLPTLSRVRGRKAREDAVGWLKVAHNAKKDAAAKLGSAVHDAVEALILDEPRPEPTDEQKPFVQAFNNFVTDWAPEFEATEMVLANPDHGWAGTGDWWAKVPDLGDVLVIGDWKSGKRVYAEAGMQLAAYSRATVGWLKDGKEVEPPHPERAVVVHLRPDAHPQWGYAMYPMDTSDATYAAFRHIQAFVEDFKHGLEETVVGEALELPAVAEVA